MNSPCLPTILRDLKIGDLPQIVSIHAAAFPTSALTQLGLEAIRRDYEWLMNGPHEAINLGCEYDGGLAGFCFSGRFNGARSGFVRHNRFFLIWTLVTHPWLIVNTIIMEQLRLEWIIFLKQVRSRRPSTIFPSPTERQRSYGILSIAVHPKYQGLGLGKALTNRAEAIARQQGFQQMHLTVHFDNMQAIRFYESQGWRKESDENGWQGKMMKKISSLSRTEYAQFI